MTRTVTRVFACCLFSDETALLAALIQKGADVNARTHGGHTALKGATSRGCTEMVRVLKKAGAVR